MNCDTCLIRRRYNIRMLCTRSVNTINVIDASRLTSACNRLDKRMSQHSKPMLTTRKWGSSWCLLFYSILTEVSAHYNHCAVSLAYVRVLPHCLLRQRGVELEDDRQLRRTRVWGMHRDEAQFRGREVNPPAIILGLETSRTPSCIRGLRGCQHG